MTRYRDPSFDFTTIRTFFCTESIAMPILKIALDADYRDEDQYAEWVKDWKVAYNTLSNVILQIRKARRTSNSDPTIAIALDSLRRVANTMLNARQYAKDRRKAVLG